MVQYPNNADYIFLDCIDNAMPAVNQTAIGFAVFGRRSARERIFLQKRKVLVETVHIGFACFLSELCKTIFVDCTQICNGSIRKGNFSHTLPAVWR